MRLPILVAGSPKLNSSLPPIRLTPGTWVFGVSGHRDTILYPVPGTRIEVKKSQTFQASIIEVGNERDLTIYVEKLE